MIYKDVKAVLFDFDGTLTCPGALDFPAIKKELGCPADKPILEFIDTLCDEPQKNAVIKRLEQLENTAARNSIPNHYAEEMIGFLKARQIPVMILTRNSINSVKTALQNFDHIGVTDFDLVMTRDSGLSPKPSGQGVLFAAAHINVDPGNILMVGDHYFDIQAGKNAGAKTAYLLPDRTGRRQTVDSENEPDFWLLSLQDIKYIVELKQPLNLGKLPNPLLDFFLRQLDICQDVPDLIIGPAIGQDVAAIQISRDDIVILKSDPITFVTQSIGRYTVLVNANDIATAGATPKWLLTTLLFPHGSTAFDVLTVMQDLNRYCREIEMYLVGGHTEITDAVKRTVVTGIMVGAVDKNRLIDKKDVAVGDTILLTKQIACEGTAILAAEFTKSLIDQGIGQKDIQMAIDLASQISIVPEAKIAASHKGVTALHDVTEGGIATALSELADVCGQRFCIDVEKIPIYEQTRRICQKLDIDPLGLIGSGSLIICCRPQISDSLIKQISGANIPITIIGNAIAGKPGIQAVYKDQPVKWPCFAGDELTRLFQ